MIIYLTHLGKDGVPGSLAEDVNICYKKSQMKT